MNRRGFFGTLTAAIAAAFAPKKAKADGFWDKRVQGPIDIEKAFLDEVERVSSGPTEPTFEYMTLDRFDKKLKEHGVLAEIVRQYSVKPPILEGLKSGGRSFEIKLR